MIQAEIKRDHRQLLVSKPTLENVRDFLVKLILCPTDDVALAHIGKDLAGARAFLAISANVASEVEKGNVALSGKSKTAGTPFYVLCSVTLDYLDTGAIV
jgi:hypothetical protein